LRLRNSFEAQEMAMYAVIRAGGKQYRVAPGDVIEIEKLAKSSGDNVQFDDVLAVSATEGEISKPAAAFVTGEVVEQGRGDKVLVFHYKRKKQYKKLQGHRQDYTAVKITGISVDGKAL
jgi:large subunit ribosomal protein L21